MLAICLLLTWAAARPASSASVQYAPTWASLDSRPLPSWYDQAKIGIFIHWGVFSVPAFGSEWFWARWRDPFDPDHKKFADFMRDNYRAGFTYADFASQFRASLFDADHWADVLQRSGAKYVVLTAKHHEGFCLWPSRHSWNWNSMDVGPGRDLVGELADAIRSKTDLKFGLYHSWHEWYNPLYDSDRRFNRTDFVTRKTLPELYELVNRYQPQLIWSDGDWTGSPEYWRSREFLAWLYNSSPVKETVVVNDRWGSGTNCRHGGYFTCQDGFNPGVLQTHKFENCFPIEGGSWGFKRDATIFSFNTMEHMLSQLASTVSCGGNVLINIGPTKDGVITPIFEERLTQLGQWLGVNGEAVYGSRPWSVQKDADTAAGDVWYTSRGGSVYAMLLRWPAASRLRLPSAPPARHCRMLGYDGVLSVSHGEVTLPPLQKVRSRWAWVLHFSTDG